MEDLVLLLWIADISDSLKETATVLAIVSGLLAVILAIASVGFALDNMESNKYSKQVSFLKKATIISFVVLVLFGSIVIVVPNKKVLYAYAGVKATKELLNTETGKLITDEGKQIIKDIGSIIHSYATEESK